MSKKSSLKRLLYISTAMIVMGFIGGAVLLPYFGAPGDNLSLLYDAPGAAYFSLVAGVVSIAVLLISYVNKGIGVNNELHKDKNGSIDLGQDAGAKVELEELKKEIENLKRDVINVSVEISNKLDGVGLTPQEKMELIESAKKRIVGNTLLLADASLKESINVLKLQVDLNQHYAKVVYRLKNEIDRLNLRGGVNLVVGVTIALVGIGYLGYTVSNQVSSVDKLSYVIHMVPRISFVLVIEIFAYFFLRLYKNGFEEVKYFQNELTNIDSKVLGIKFLKGVRNEDLMSKVIESLMATERNFILEKGQSTVLLEKEKIKSADDKNLADTLKEILKVKR